MSSKLYTEGVRGGERRTITRSSFGSVERRSTATGGARASFVTVTVRGQHQLDHPSRWPEGARLTIVDEQRGDLQIPPFLAWSRVREEEGVQRQLPIALGTAHLVGESRRARETGKSRGRIGASFISASRPIQGPCAPS